LRPQRLGPHRLAVAAALALLVAVPAAAQPADPQARQQLLDLAYVLGEAHALRQACKPDDQYWRSRMRRVLEVERPDAAFAGRLADRFNTGFSVRKAQHPACTAKARAELKAVARRGRDLAYGLSRFR